MQISGIQQGSYDRINIFLVFLPDYCLDLVRDKDLIGKVHGKFTYK